MVSQIELGVIRIPVGVVSTDERVAPVPRSDATLVGAWSAAIERGQIAAAGRIRSFLTENEEEPSAVDAEWV
jgi:hypothetical protein